MVVDLKPCAFCNENKSLVNSHAIPNAFFKDLKSTNNGTMRRLHEEKGRKNTTESGYCLLLCSDCEQYFNNKYDKYSISWVRKTCLDPNSIVNHDVIAGFIISVLWRASLSAAQTYSGYKITDFERDTFSRLVHEDEKIYQEFSFEVAHLIDTGLTLSRAQLVNTIAAPFRAAVKIDDTPHVMHHFIVRGVFMAAITPRVPIFAKNYRYLNRGANGAIKFTRDIAALSNYRKIEHLAKAELASNF